MGTYYSFTDQDEIRLATQQQLESHGLFRSGDVILIKDDKSLSDQDIPACSKRERFSAIEREQVIPGRNHILQYVGDDPADLDLSAEPFHSPTTIEWPDHCNEIGSRRILIPNPIFHRGWNAALANHWFPGKKPTECGLWARNIVELTSWQPASELKEKTSRFLDEGFNDLFDSSRRAEP